MAAPLEQPAISVVIPTRDRGASVTAAIDSLLANQWPTLKVIVVDQSLDDRTRQAVAAYGDTVRYIHSEHYGVSAARNLGAGQTESPLIGFIDDDCEVASNWLQTLATAFQSDTAVGVLFGNVLPGNFDAQLGFIPSYVLERPFTARSIRDKNQVEGISACMATTREAWQHIHGFDAMLGVGAPLGSGAETDYTIRALLAGYHVCESPALQVTHHGFRNWRDGKQLVHRYWFGTGAMFAKHIKYPRLSVLAVMIGLAGRWFGGGHSRLASSFGDRSYRLLQLSAFLRGFARGLYTPADRHSGHFRDIAAVAE